MAYALYFDYLVIWPPNENSHQPSLGTQTKPSRYSYILCFSSPHLSMTPEIPFIMNTALKYVPSSVSSFCCTSGADYLRTIQEIGFVSPSTSICTCLSPSSVSSEVLHTGELCSKVCQPPISQHVKRLENILRSPCTLLNAS